MRKYEIILKNNPVDEYQDRVIPRRIGKYECFDPVEWLIPTSIIILENELAEKLYDLIDSGFSFEVKI